MAQENNDNTMDMASYAEFQRQFKGLKEAHRQVLYAVRAFWQILTRHDVQYLTLAQQFNKVDRSQMLVRAFLRPCYVSCCCLLLMLNTGPWVKLEHIMLACCSLLHSTTRLISFVLPAHSFGRYCNIYIRSAHLYASWVLVLAYLRCLQGLYATLCNNTCRLKGDTSKVSLCIPRTLHC